VLACAIVIHGFAARHSPAPPGKMLAIKPADPIPIWRTVPDQALAAARSAGGDTLMVFDGPASGDEAASFGMAVFDTPEFREHAGRSFTLLRLASSPDAAPDQAVQVSTWGQRLGVSQFPTLALVDSQGRPYAMAALRSKDMAEAIKTLDSLAEIKVKRDEFFAAARSAEGIERARKLDAGLELVKPVAGESYVEVMRQILDFDPDNAAALRAKYQNAVAEVDINHAIQAEVYPLIDKGNLVGAVQRIDRLIAGAGASPEQRQLLLAFKGQLYFSLHDTQSAARSFDDAVRIAPNSDAAAKVLAARAQVFGSPS
jgi:tetratricopeptide (TPR) repeat protein